MKITLFSPCYFELKNLNIYIKKYSKRFKGGVLLDFGCGDKPYQKLFNVGKYIGLEHKSTNKAFYKSKGVEFYEGDKIPFEDNYFDCLVSFQVFEHVENLDLIIKELNRVLKTDAKVLITVPLAWEEHGLPYDFRRFTSYGITSFLSANGFKVLSFENSSNYVEAIFQMNSNYIWSLDLPTAVKHSIILINNLIGILCSKIMPKRYKFYLNNVVYAKKTKDCE